MMVTKCVLKQILIAAGGIMCEIHEGVGLEGKEIGGDDYESSTSWANHESQQHIFTWIFVAKIFVIACLLQKLQK